MKFDSAINSLFKKTLKKIRVKVDPLYASSENFMDFDSYIGYILEEDAESLRIMVVKPGYPVVNFPRTAMLPSTILDSFTTFVESKISLLKGNTSHLRRIQASSFEQLEELLSNGGYTNKEILGFYRDFLKIYENTE
jgi:hypothetical protein